MRNAKFTILNLVKITSQHFSKHVRKKHHYSFTGDKRTDYCLQKKGAVFYE